MSTSTEPGVILKHLQVQLNPLPPSNINMYKGSSFFTL